MERGTISIPKGLIVRQTVETLFNHFRTSQLPETEWARRLLRQEDVTDAEIRMAIAGAIERFCPATPREFVPFIIDLLAAGIRASRYEGLDIVTQTRTPGDTLSTA